MVKNTLTLRAARELERGGMENVLIGPTAVAFGYGDVSAVAKTLIAYIASARSPLIIHGAMMDGSILSAEQVRGLALLPPREELLARLIGQMQAPIAGLVNVLSAPLRNLAYVLQRIADQGGAQREATTPVPAQGPGEKPLSGDGG